MYWLEVHGVTVEEIFDEGGSTIIVDRPLLPLGKISFRFLKLLFVFLFYLAWSDAA